MTTKVTVKQIGGSRKLVLDADQTRLFSRELARIRRYFPAGKWQSKIGIGADCSITVKSASGSTVYLLYGRAVLRQQKNNKTWQFYFGVLLMEWLYH